jgi:hypothetical protein
MFSIDQGGMIQFSDLCASSAVGDRPPVVKFKSRALKYCAKARHRGR